jgi:hypothetical protein
MKQRKFSRRRSISKRRQQKRFNRKIAGRLRRKLRRGGKVNPQVFRRLKVKRRGLKYQRPIQNKPISPTKWQNIYVPKIFCLIDNPEGSNAFFNKLRKDLFRQPPANLFVSHEKTERVGLSASFIFDSLINECLEYWKTKNVEIGIRGEISKIKEVNNFLLSFGFLKSIGISPDRFDTSRYDIEYQTKYETHKMMGSNHDRSLSSIASTGLADYFNNCLEYNDFKLTDAGRGILTDAFGEIICNAEEHCGIEKGKWHTLGCYEKDYHICKFSIINFGKTIFETLSDKESTSKDVIEKIEQVIHSNRSFFEKTKKVFFPKQQEEPIWNVMALQEGISSKRTVAGRGSTRGQGMMDILEFIDDIKSDDENGCVAVLSGRSHILIDYAYPIRNVTVGATGEMRRQIAFNKEGDLHGPQDEKLVSFIPSEFPGVIITGRFKIDNQYLIRKSGYVK